MAQLRDRLQQALGATYRLERELPGGGMSRVFLATELRLARMVVVKVLPPETSAAVQGERFAREVQVAASLQHPHIVPLLTAGISDGMAWYVMPFIEGETLAAKLHRDGALGVGEALRILRDVVDALAYSHAHGIVHRDIKPDNILISGRHALVTDFGVAKALSVSATQRGTLTTGGVALGTPTYMAPEQATADPNVDHRADLYSVGVVAYEMLTGRTPFVATTPQAMLTAHVTQYPDHITLHRPSLPPTIAAAVMKCLEKHPADRWQGASEFATLIDLAGTPSGGMAPVPSLPHPALEGYRAQGGERSDPVRVSVLFTLASIVVVAMIFGATRVFGLPDWVWIGALGLMVVGFPIVMYTGRVERGRAELARAGKLRFSNPPLFEALFTWRNAIYGGFLALGALLFSAAGYAVARSFGIGPAGTLLSSGVMGTEDRFVLADFVNHTPDSILATAVTEALRVDLGQSRVVRMLSDREVATALTRMTLRPGMVLTDSISVDLARREGVKAVITGEIAPLGTGYVLTANVVEAANGETRTAVRATANDAGHLLGALNDLSAQLRERIGESLRSIRSSEPLEQVTTGSMEALQLYSTGARVFAAGEYDSSRAYFERAVSVDPTFAMAWRKLAVVLLNTSAPYSQMAAAARKAYERRDRLTPLEAALTEAFYDQNVLQDQDKAIAAYQDALTIDPSDLTARNNLGMAFYEVERFADEEALLWPATTPDAGFTFYDNLGLALAAQGKFGAVDSMVAAMQLTVPNSGYHALTIRYNAALLARDRNVQDSLIKVAPSVPMDRSSRWIAEWDQAWHQVAGGQQSAGLALFDKVAAEEWTGGFRGPALSDALNRPFAAAFFSHDRATARRLLNDALRRYPIGQIPATDVPYADIADARSYFGEIDEVHRLRREWETATPPEERVRSASAEWDAREARARGEWLGAVHAYEAARQARPCGHCFLYEMGMALDKAGQADSARVILERAVSEFPVGDEVTDQAYLAPTLRRLGELYEAKGDKSRARDYYQRFVDLWRNADPALQPQVTDARQRIAALGTDPPSHP